MQTTCGDDHARFASSFNGVDGGGTGGADIIDDDDAGAFTAEAFDAPACSMLLFGFADKEAVNQRRAGMGNRTPGAGGGYVGNDGIRAERKAADGFCLNVILLKQIKDGFSSEATAFGVERSGSAVDVVVTGAA